MGRAKYRFPLYVGLGLVFGVFDWFYLDWLSHFSWGALGQTILVVPIILLLNFGIWLVPIIPVVIFEAARSEKVLLPMLAGMLTWACSIFSYYAYYAILLSTGKLVHLEHLSILGQKDETFWPEYWQVFDRIITGQFREWIVLALIGGAVLGALASWGFRKIYIPRFFATRGN